MIDLQALSDDVKPLILAAGEMIRAAWIDHHFTETKKGEADSVTNIDVVVEDFLRNKLSLLLPAAGFIVEEGITDRHADYNWSIDPIDGTKFFAHGVSMFHTQVAFLDKDLSPLLSFVYNPISHQLFSAIKGFGSLLNDKKIELPPERELKNAVINFDAGNLKEVDENWKFDVYKRIASKCYRTRSTAGYLTPYMLTGAIHAFVNLDITQPYSIKNIADLAPHKILLTEGGYQEKMLDFNGHPVLIWACSPMQEELKSALNLI